jgi:hypothetical protein
VGPTVDRVDRGWYRGWMGAGELSIEERILLTRTYRGWIQRSMSAGTLRNQAVRLLPKEGNVLYCPAGKDHSLSVTLWHAAASWLGFLNSIVVLDAFSPVPIPKLLGRGGPATWQPQSDTWVRKHNMFTCPIFFLSLLSFFLSLSKDVLFNFF